MKIWDKFNAGFQLCPPDFNFAPPPPRSREAGDAPELYSNSSSERLFFRVQVQARRYKLQCKILPSNGNILKG